MYAVYQLHNVMSEAELAGVYLAHGLASKKFFPNKKPARSALGANGLALGAKVEVECMACKSKMGVD